MQAGLAQLTAINHQVNHSVTFKTDLANYGVREKWAYPTAGFGDCEDYALLKRHLLIEAGFDPEKLNLAICEDANGQGHAVLAADLPDATYILDNQTDAVMAWSNVPYRWDRISLRGSFQSWAKIDA